MSLNKYATSKHLGAIIANAGSMPSELSGFGCKGVGAEHITLSYDEWKIGLIPLP